MPDDDPFDAFVDDLLENGEQNPPAPAPVPDVDVNQPRVPPAWMSVILTTTHSVPGMQISQPLGIVMGRVAKGQGPWKNFKMLLGSDGFGGRSVALEKEFHAMEQECFRQLKVAANQKGANAVVGVTIQFGETSGEADLFFVVAAGTAVRCEPF